MKISIKGNNLRLRLSSEDWQKFKNNSKVEQDVPFGYRQKLIYCVKITDQSQQIEASLNHPFVMVMIPRNLAKSWIDQSNPIISGEVPVADGETLKIQIERPELKQEQLVHFPESNNN